jgi:hypothetical protein
MIDGDQCGAVAGNRSTRRKPVPMLLCPLQIPHDLTWDRTRAAAVGSGRLTAWAKARPKVPVLITYLKMQLLLLFHGWNFHTVFIINEPITMAARSKAWTVFTLSNAGIVGSNLTQGIDVCICVRLYCVCVFLCVGRSLATGWSPTQRVLLTVYRLKKLKNPPRPNKGP